MERFRFSWVVALEEETNKEEVVREEMGWMTGFLRANKMIKKRYSHTVVGQGSLRLSINARKQQKFIEITRKSTALYTWLAGSGMTCSIRDSPRVQSTRAVDSHTV